MRSRRQTPRVTALRYAGMGEAGTSCIVPAVASAIFAATRSAVRPGPVIPLGCLPGSRC